MNVFRTVGFSLSLVVGISIVLWFSIVHLTHLIIERVIQ